jgi:hypothetical protein
VTATAESEIRSLYVGLIYNWQTRVKEFVLWSEVGERLLSLQPDECVYLLDVALAPPKDIRAPVQRAWVHLVRHDNPKPLPPGRMLHDWILCNIDSYIMQSLPHGTYSHERGPYQGRVVSCNERQSVVAFSIPGHHFKLTIDALTAEEYERLPLWGGPPPEPAASCLSGLRP